MSARLDPQCMPDEFFYVGPRCLKKNLVPLLRQYVADDVDEARQIWAVTVLECQGQPHAVAARLNHLISRGRAAQRGAAGAAYGHAQMRGWSPATEAGDDGVAAHQIWAEWDTAPQPPQASSAELDAALGAAAAMLPRQTARALRMVWAGADREEILAALGVDDRRLRQMLGDAELAVRASQRGGLRAAAAVLRARSDRRHALSRPVLDGQLSLLGEEVLHA
ncbi:MAG: hypothetical protein P8011_00145 [Acidihalobacter sp.]